MRVYTLATTRQFHATALVLDLVRANLEVLDALLLPGDLRAALLALREADADLVAKRAAVELARA